MGNVIVTPNMSLPNPVPGVDPGPDYANNLESSLNILDGHNHAPPNGGVQVPSGGININAPLPANNQPITGLQAAIFTDQTSLSTLNALYTIGSELWYNDSSGAVQITAAGAVNATSSGISSGSASAAFSSSVLVVNEASNTPANIQTGSILIGNNTAGSDFVTVSAPSSTTTYTLTLPTIPAATAFMTINNSGAISGSVPIANGITRPNLAAVGQVVTASSTVETAANTSYSVIFETPSITTSGRPVILTLTSDSSGIPSCVGGINTGSSGTVSFQILRGATVVYNSQMSIPGGETLLVPPGTISFIDQVSAGTYNYYLEMKSSASSLSYTIQWCIMVAYEL